LVSRWSKKSEIDFIFRKVLGCSLKVAAVFVLSRLVRRQCESLFGGRSSLINHLDFTVLIFASPDMPTYYSSYTFVI